MHCCVYICLVFFNWTFIWPTVYGKGQDEMSDEWDLPSSQNDDAGYVISKLEPLSDEEEIDEEHYTDASDME